MIMTHKDRFLATIARTEADRSACWLGLPVPDAIPALRRYFKVNSIDKLKEKIGDDIYPAEVPYHNLPENHIACTFDFAKKLHGSDYKDSILTAAGLIISLSHESILSYIPPVNIEALKEISETT